jgi:hypothetical protein
VRAPDGIRSTIEEACVEPLVTLYRPDPHFMYGLGRERLLHLYVEPTSRLREGLAARERIRRQTGLRGIPRQIALGESIDAVGGGGQASGRAAASRRRGALVRRSRQLGARPRRSAWRTCT